MNKKERIKKKKYYNIIPAYNIEGPLCYSGYSNIALGSLVIINVRNKRITGCVIEKLKEKPKKNFVIKDILEEKTSFCFEKQQISFFKWFSDYNVCTKGAALKLMLPDINFLKLKSNIYYKIKEENKEK